MSTNMNIPEKYYRGEHPVIATVGELKACLAELPDDLPIEGGFSRKVEVVVYNHGDFDVHLELSEHYEEDDESEDVDEN